MSEPATGQVPPRSAHVFLINGLFTLADDSFAVASVQVSLLDDMVLGVHPVHAAASVVYGEAVGPEKVRVCNDAPVGSVHVGILDAWRVAPVSPVDLPKHWRVSVSYSCNQRMSQ